MAQYCNRKPIRASNSNSANRRRNQELPHRLHAILMKPPTCPKRLDSEVLPTPDLKIATVDQLWEWMTWGQACCRGLYFDHWQGRWQTGASAENQHHEHNQALL